MRNTLIGKPQNVVDPEQDPIVQDNAFVQRVQMYDGLFGALIDAEAEPLFLSCREMLGLCMIVQQHQAWFEEHARYNEQWSQSETLPTTYAFLRQKENPDVQIIISLKRQTDRGWYGTHVPPLRSVHGPPVSGDEDVQEFLTEQWEEYEKRMVLC